MNILSEINIEGRSFFLVDPGNSAYVKGILVKYLVVPKSQMGVTYPDTLERLSEEVINEPNNPSDDLGEKSENKEDGRAS